MKNTLYILWSVILLFSSCQSNSQSNNKDQKQAKIKNITPVQVKSINNLERAYFASGCFWCVEAIYESVKGVKESVSGYSGGHTQNPTYQTSNTGRTGHAEAVEITYDPKIISFSTLVDIYFGSQNPTQIDGQGPDNGSQYRSIIFYQNEKQRKIIEEKKETLSKKLNKRIAAEILPFQKFWKGEAYHQDYEKRNPNNPYIQNISKPRLKRFQAKFPNLIKEIH
ncbi:peptide-methionine (S)-S-oxide reductase MsrA [Aquimarina muelleri]|uniref:Peptide methionine sulfoxide reductase MsrA n=1 Tax=Aquimarina muelleri TaxID=279356 RepID=A0A918JYU6_9FLAO|nr:peptide-methionine (S)-S-oxide reductase MsrA [Aquimarina muelleri]MCX2765051.1 peptide-methionine (S)-S-oxide reductase MsrA [Aquimarina muelleri]GGX29095.1 peptide methionine sulfoxide reductase MsrA [Aquimarina muelleri]